jgi:hypothetical protein
VAAVHEALTRAPNPRQEERLVDYLSVIQGIEAWARLIDPQDTGAAPPWHGDLLRAVLQLCYAEGYTLGCGDPEADHAGAYHLMLDRFTAQAERTIRGETPGALSQAGRDAAEIFRMPQSGRVAETLLRSRLRRWAQRQPLLRSLYHKLRGPR